MSESNNSAKKNFKTNAAEKDEKRIALRNSRYNKYVKAVSPSTGVLRSLASAFLVGGLFCIAGEGLKDGFLAIFPSFDAVTASSAALITMIVLAIIATGFGVFDILARRGGAGCFLPITGFANAMASASMEHKSEGLIMGTSVKLFSVVGPVLVNGVVWASVAGLIRLLISVIF
ncbi:MAG: SpoVA/SpoVAEb family sporulation membrane protein [Firmicutes bacterium]|nr:SpoVA/SpoVAEb family sporulation membrane protein [Bacillota bacterium]